jgi:hypothetical protein
MCESDLKSLKIYELRMRVSSALYDRRIEAHNVLFDFTIAEYLAAVTPVLEKNEFQRKRVSGSKSVYSLLKEDIAKGCVFPPIVLALTTAQAISNPLSDAEAEGLVEQHTGDLLILDGLQRTYTLLDLHRELQGPALDDYLAKTIRIEIYIGINRLGILYRMLTLNTGQTPMSLRQQTEMLYADFRTSGVNGIVFIREVDEQHATLINEFNFKDTIDGFTSYLERNELPMDRADLLESIKSLESLSLENSKKELFTEFVTAWLTVLREIDSNCGNEQLDSSDLDDSEAGWGKNALQIFKRSQALTGFGAALGRLRDLKLIAEIADAATRAKSFDLGGEAPRDFFLSINRSIRWINLNTKKIGNAQRMYFYFFFRELLNGESESYLNLSRSVESALHNVKTRLL